MATPPTLPVPEPFEKPKVKAASAPATKGTPAVAKSAEKKPVAAKKPGDDQASALPDEVALQEEEQQTPQPDFWRQPWVQNVLPLVTSLMFHVAIITIGILTYKAVQQVVKKVEEQIIIPESTLSETTPGGIPHPGLGGDPTRDAAQDLDKTVPPDSTGLATKASDNLNQAAAGATGDSDASEIGVGANAAIGGKGSGGLTGAGEGGGNLAPFGVPGGGGGIGPKSNFLGLGGNARKIMYLVDASGSMLGVFGQLKVELKKSIDGLKPVQSFNIVIFSDDNVFPLSKEGLVMATPDNKRRAYDFIDNAVATGGTQPIPAIKFAMAEHPELTYVLTDGFDQIANFDDVINAFAQGNADKRMKINCIFLQSDEDPKLVEVLQKIAKDNGGMMKTILKSDF
jgi:hypothetical protein